MSFNRPSPSTYDFLMNRRSVKTRDMVTPGPDNGEIKEILTAAMRVPDHGKLAPWRFIVLDTRGEQEKFGRLISEALMAENAGSADTAAKMAGYATQAPVLVIAVHSPDSSNKKIPLWEQQLSTGAACQNLLVAAHAKGFVGQWLTGWAATSDTVADGLGLANGERIAGFIFLGSQGRVPSERPRPAYNDRVSHGFPA